MRAGKISYGEHRRGVFRKDRQAQEPVRHVAPFREGGRPHSRLTHIANTGHSSIPWIFPGHASIAHSISIARTRKLDMEKKKGHPAGVHRGRCPAIETFDLIEFQQRARDLSCPKKLFELWEDCCQRYERREICIYDLEEMKEVIIPNLKALASLRRIVNDPLPETSTRRRRRTG